MHEPRLFTAADLKAGLQSEFERGIAAEDIAAFAELSGDHNPLHVDEAYAQQTNYQRRIVHGAFQVGLASAMAGMYLPGREVVVGSFQCRFPAPLYYPSRVRVQGEITSWVAPSLSGNLRVRITDLATLILTAEIHVAFALHEKRAAAADRPQSARTAADGKPLVLVTGAGGGLGSRFISVLAERYQVVGMSRSRPERDDAPEWVGADLSSSGWEHELEAQLQGRPLYGIVHAAWPTGPQGGLLDVETEAVASQLEFAGPVTIRLARFLRSHAQGGGRLVVLGSTAATLKPVVNMSAYSLGKAALEHTIRLLAPELARSGITVNLVVPSFIPVGMNSAKTNRVILTETAKVPIGRLCSPEDVTRAVEFFLSEGSAFITGQMLPLTGGQF